MRISTRAFLLSTMAFISLFLSACKDDDDAVITVKTFSVTNVSATSGTIRGTVSAKGFSIKDAGIVYSTSVKNPKITTCQYVSASSDSLTDFKCVMRGLSSDSMYYFRTFARTSDSIYYGITYTFSPVNISMETVSIEGGTFTMGATDEQSAFALANENPAHSVLLGSFQIGKFEVTNAQFALFMRSRHLTSSGSCMTSDGNGYVVVCENLRGLYYNKDSAQWQVLKKYENLPVVNVTWYGANEFCKWAGGRLPTEAEWEFAARGGISTNNHIYCGSDIPDEVAWYHENISDLDNPVQLCGGKASNELEIYDMSGNVWEWVADWYDTYSSSSDLQTNPTGPTDVEADDAKITVKVRRGGGWADTNVSKLRVSSRSSSIPTLLSGSTGFRFAKDVF